MVSPSEPEFQQARNEIYSTLGPVFQKRPELKNVFSVLEVPERVVQFRVLWEDDKGAARVNTGYRVQFNSALGPYKGGLRFHPSVNLSILKFLGFEQIFKNALTGLPMGGGKGGSDFEPKGKSDGEIRRFCESFMRELSRHIGENTDVPAGDIGVTGKEVGYMFGAYRRARNQWAGVLTGKGLDWGGSFIRPEATGYGTVYYVQKMIAEAESIPLADTFKNKTVAVSGSGNVAQYAALKVMDLGGKVLSLSDSKGTLISESGFTRDDIFKIQDLKLAYGYLKDAGFSQYKYIEGSRPWTHFPRLDVALPCATQNEVSGAEAEHLINAGVKYVAEGSNMGSTQEAVDLFEEAGKKGGLWYAPGKASNCGGVAVSGLEMAQNSSRDKWTAAVVDDRLKEIMYTCYDVCFETGKEYSTEKGGRPSLVAGANIAGFLKVADASISHGDAW